MDRVIVVFLKYPTPGRVKTRLAAGIGDSAAVLAYRKMVCKVLEQCRVANPEAIAIAYDPAEREAEIQEWLSPYLDAYSGEVHWIPQFGEDLGERLRFAAAAVFHRKPDSNLAMIGTDCVHLDPEIFARTWEHLGSGKDAVFGPTEDGGYYLLGIRKPEPSLFADIPWSSENTLAASISAGEAAGLGIVLLEPRIDIDTEAEWERVEREVSQRRCVFFDRDGVVNRSPGAGYVLREEEFHLHPEIADALLWLKKRGWLAIVITSQKGVGKGLMTGKDLDEIHRGMQQDLAKKGAAFDGIYAFTGEPDCPHQPKPDPEMIVTASESFFVDRRQSWMIGDADRDIEMGKAAGLAGTIRVRGEKEIGVAADHTLDSIAGIVEIFEKVL